MSRFERWLWRRLLAKRLQSGLGHPKRLTAVYQEIHNACKQEFSEDNAYALEDYLHERFMQTQTVLKAGARHHHEDPTLPRAT